MPATIDTLLFDLDGTLVDTEPAAARVVSDCFRRWNIAMDPNDAAFVTGRTWASAFDFLFGKYAIPVSREEAAQQVMETYRRNIASHLDVVPGSAAAVRALADSGRFKLGLVSGSNRAEILLCLDKLGVRECFEVIYGAEDYPRSKPAPDGYLKAIQTLGRDPARTLVFEDSQPGIASGRAAGAWVVAITGTNHFGQDTALAHHHVADLRGVDADWVARLASTSLG